MAQAPSNPIYIGLEAQAAIQSSNKSLLSNNVQLGWKATDRLSIYAASEGLVFLSKSKDIRTYNRSWNVGGGIGYDFHKDNILSTTFFCNSHT